MVAVRAFDFLFEFPAVNFFILALGREWLVFSEPEKRTCFEQGPISALFIFISIFDFDSV